MQSGVIPSRDLQAFRRALNAGSATVVIAGDSTGTQAANNQIAPTENFFGMIASEILNQNRDAISAGATINFVDRSVPGVTYQQLATTVGYSAASTGAATSTGGVTTIPVVIPAGVSTGWYVWGTTLGGSSTAAIPIATQSGTSLTVSGTYTVASGATIVFQPPGTPSWMTSPNVNWIQFYVQPLAPDLVIVPMGTNDSNGIAGNYLQTVYNYFQNASNFPKTPSVVLVSNSGRIYTNAATVASQLNASSTVRSFAESNGNGLGLTGNAINFGLIDLGRVDTIARLGYDPTNQYMVQSINNVSGITTYPYNFPASNGDFDAQLYFPSGSTTFLGTGQSWRFYIGSTIASGSQTPQIYWFYNSGYIQGIYYPPGGGSISLPNILLGSADLYITVTVKQSRLIITYKSYYGGNYQTNVALNTNVFISGGPFTPKLTIASGSLTPSMTIQSYSAGVPIGMEPSGTDDQVWGTGLSLSIAGTGGNGINHVSSFGAARLIRNALGSTRLNAHDGALQSLIQTLTPAGTTQATATPVTGDISNLPTVASGTGLVLVSQVIYERQFKILNRGSNAVLIYPPVGSVIEAAATNASVSLAAGSTATFMQVSATQWRQF